jgi:hypothetical protein
MIITDQKTVDTTPNTLPRADRYRVRVGRVEHGLDRVDRAGPDVAEDDAQRADHDGGAQRLPVAGWCRRGRRGGRLGAHRLLLRDRLPA